MKLFNWILSCFFFLFIFINSLHSQKLRCIQTNQPIHLKKDISLRSTPPILNLVFHIVYNTEEENISDQQILEQVAILNEAFNNLFETETKASGAYPVAGISGIQFKLADKDPLGEPTSGILRVKTDSRSIGDLNINNRDAVKYNDLMGSDAWDTDRYINIWVAKRDLSLGYTVGLDSVSSPDEGLIINFNNIGNTNDIPYHQGKTMVHEMGHYLGLFHPWVENNQSLDCGFHADRIPDMYTSLAPAQGCELPPRCYRTPFVGNYMDFYDDDCMFYFTKGQCMKMQHTLEQLRPTLLEDQHTFPMYLPPNSSIKINFNGQTIEIYGSSNDLLERINFYVINGQIASSIKMQDKYYEQLSLTDFAPGIYFVEVLTEQSRKIEKIYIP